VEKQTKISYILLAFYIVGTILHNLYFALTGVQEAPILVIAFLAGILFLLSLVYNVFTFMRKGKPKDLWKLGWIGFIGFLGMIPGFGFGFFGLYGFYGFFGFKNKK
jgi:hypothetical protein